VVRPPADPGVSGLTAEQMQAASLAFAPGKTEVIGHFTGCVRRQSDAALEERVRELLRRRPCTVDEMAVSLAISADELGKACRVLQQRGILAASRFAGQDYFCLAVRPVS
jgi:hypothetical protein